MVGASTGAPYGEKSSFMECHKDIQANVENGGERAGSGARGREVCAAALRCDSLARAGDEPLDMAALAWRENRDQEALESLSLHSQRSRQGRSTGKQKWDRVTREAAGHRFHRKSSKLSSTQSFERTRKANI